MKIRSIFLAVSIILVLVSSVVMVPLIAAQDTSPLDGQGQFIQLVVQPGDSMAKYAPIYGVSGSAMLAVNRLSTPDLIFPGQQFIIPVIKTTTPSLTTPFYYTVQSGDTLTSIGNMFHMDASVIAFANDTVGDTVLLGKTYLIPAGPHREIIKKGEHLGIIADRYRVTVSFLMKANPSVANPSQLLIGQRIHIPVIYDAKPVPVTEAPIAFIPETATSMPTETTTPLPPTATLPAPVLTATAAVPILITTLTPNDLSSNTFFFFVVVQPNESLINYQQRFGVSGARIIAVNRALQTNPDLIFPGQILIIPAIATFNPSRSTPFFYTVQPGDTVFNLATRFEMTTDVLISANPTASFAAGTNILVPAGPHEYFLKPGKSLATAAAKYLIPLTFLLKANPGFTSPDMGFTGQRVFIPLRIDASPVPFN